MKKIIIVISLIFVLFFLVLSITKKEKNFVNEQIVYKNTINISRAYIALRIKTEKVLIKALEYGDYSSWNKDMNHLLDNWKNLEAKANILEIQANFSNKEKVSFKLINETKAYTKNEISNVFDKAPAGKKIRTLAKYLGVDAKRAYEILKNDQEFVKADAWNEAGDAFKKLETSAVVIKDGCKITGYIGAVAITGGAVAGATLGSAGVGTALVGGSATFAETTGLVVTGTDLVLEIGEDTAIIALGDNHQTVEAFSNMRKYTDPAASILSLTDISQNVSKGAKILDKVGVVLMEIDQIRSILQDGKLLGINVKSDSKIEVASLEKGEEKKWIKNNLKNSQIIKSTKQYIEQKEEEKEKIKEEQDIQKDISIESDEQTEIYVANNYEDIDDWLESFEDLDDWLNEFEIEEEFEEPEDNFENNNKEKFQKKQSIEEQLQELLEENEERRLTSWQGEKTPSTFEELEEHAKKFTKINEERRAWLRGECINIYGQGEDAENCILLGK